MNLSTYIRRFLPIIEQACATLPDNTSFVSTSGSPFTHTVRLRQVRKHLIDHLDTLPIHLRTPEFLDKLRSLNFWYVDDTVYLGHRSSFGIDQHILTHASGTSATHTYNTISRPLTKDELQALFYCYNAGLFSLPTKIENPSPDILQLTKQFSDACPNVGIAHNENSITLL